MLEMIIGVMLVIAGGFGVFALSEDINDYMQNHNYISQLD